MLRSRPLPLDTYVQQAQIHLDEDALELWQIALRNAVTIQGLNSGPGLIDLVPLVVDQLANNLELSGTIVHIIESYFMLDAPHILQVSILSESIQLSSSSLQFVLI